MLRVAIVGRPNVGKSTLFNRLAGRRLAIVHDLPGVTRDRRIGVGRLGDIELELIDTAGFEDVTDDSLEARMRSQTEAAVQDAQILLFVIDARAGVTADDEVFAQLLRRSGRPVIVVANKSEGSAGDAGATDAFALGLGEPVPISAEHGEGLGELYRAVVEAMGAAPIEAPDEALEPDDLEQGEDDDRPIRIAVVGRPNAGKSTLINALIGEDRLLTGPEAGITRDAIGVEWRFEGRRVRLVDTAGLRRKAKVEEGLEQLSARDTLRAITFAEVVLLVMDAAHPFETQDLTIADLVEREGRALVFVLAKWDLIADQAAVRREWETEAERLLPQLRGAPIVPLSAQTGAGLQRLMPAVLSAHTHWATKLKTRDLNDWLRAAVERHPPPAVGGLRARLKYMAQTKARPPTFVLFASRADKITDSYKRYLVNSLRHSFDLPGTPVRITVRSGANPYAGQGDAPVRSSRGGRPAPHARSGSRPPRRAPPRP